MRKYAEYKTRKEWLAHYAFWDAFPEFCERYLKILKEEGGTVVPLVLNPVQLKVLQIIVDTIEAGKPPYFIILKARRLGMSTLIEAILFWLVVTGNGFNTAVITHKDDATQNLYGMFLTYWGDYTSPFKPGADTKNKNVLKFDNKCSVQLFTAGDPEGMRSFAKQGIHMSETAFWKQAKTAQTAVMQTLPDTALVFDESTANGVGNPFYERWTDAVKGANEFVPIFIPWFDNPLYSTAPKPDEKPLVYTAVEKRLVSLYHLTENQMRWRRKRIATKCGNDVNVFHQEYPSSWEEAFLSTGSPYFAQEALSRIHNNLVMNPPIVYRGILNFTETNDVVFVPDEDVLEGGRKTDCAAVEIYAHPIPNDCTERRYCIGVDTSEGIDKSLSPSSGIKKSTSNETDFSFITVRDRVTGKQVAISRNKLAADKLAELGVKLMIYYRTTIFVKDDDWHYSYPIEVIEKNGIGLSTVKETIRLCNLFKIPTHRLYSQEQFPSGTVELPKEQDVGWRTVSGVGDSTKKSLLLKSQMLIRDSFIDGKFEDKTGIQSIIVVEEHQHFISYSNGKIGAKQGKHDDGVMSDALAREGDKRDDTPVVVVRKEEKKGWQSRFFGTLNQGSEGFSFWQN
jgi:hypothetical protein